MGLVEELGDGSALLRIAGDVPAVPVAEENLGPIPIEDDGAAGADFAGFGEGADSFFVVAPNDEVEDGVRIGLIEIDEGGGAVAGGRGVFVHDLAADGAVLTDVLSSFDGGEDGGRGLNRGWAGGLAGSDGQDGADDDGTHHETH